MEAIFKFYVKEFLTIPLVENVIEKIESLTGESLNYSISSIGKQIRLESRKKFLSNIEQKNSESKDFPLITNGKNDNFITLSGLYITENDFGYANTSMWYITLETKKNSPQELSVIFASTVNRLDNYWAKLSPETVEGVFFDQSQPDYKPRQGYNLPKLPFDPPFDSPHIPLNLGWLNYWPAPTLKRINFQEHHRALFHSVQPAANDGLILQITEQPLDFDIAEHLRKTVAIYDALPAIGGRDCV